MDSADIQRDWERLRDFRRPVEQTIAEFVANVEGIMASGDDKQATETEQDWARRIGLAGQAEQSEESIRQVARVIGTYYHALIAVDVPKRLAAELTFAYQDMVMRYSLAALDQHAGPA